MPDEPLPRLEGDAQSDAAWHRARRRAVALEAVLAAEGARSAAVAAAARELALSTRQVYALLRSYEPARNRRLPAAADGSAREPHHPGR